MYSTKKRIFQQGTCVPPLHPPLMGAYGIGESRKPVVAEAGSRIESTEKKKLNKL